MPTQDDIEKLVEVVREWTNFHFETHPPCTPRDKAIYEAIQPWMPKKPRTVFIPIANIYGDAYHAIELTPEVQQALKDAGWEAKGE